MRSRRPDLPQPPRNDRPGDKWVCGHSGAGCPCPAGPTPDGQCQGSMGGCNPIGTSPKLRCGRPAYLGGPCSTGPLADGSCGLVAIPCRPQRSFAARWSRATKGIAIGSMGILLLLAFLPVGTEFFAPGPMSAGHRQILGTTLATERCGACHPGAEGSLAQWFLKGGDAHRNVSQTDLCLNCHHALVPKSQPRSPHGLNDSQLANITDQLALISGGRRPLLPRLQKPDQQLECAACHREHHGSVATLTAVSDSQCQVCHQQPFDSFTLGHPDWHQWPYGRGGEIRFDHRSHMRLHYPNKQATWNCQDCHQRTERGELTRTVDYQIACASCHETALKQQTSEGFALFQVPSIDVEQLRATQTNVPNWPSAATGFTELTLPPVMQLLLASQGFDVTLLNAEEKSETTAALMAAINNLADEMRSKGATVISKRLESLGYATSRSQDLVKTLPLQIIEQTTWWPSNDPNAFKVKSALKPLKIQRTVLLQSEDLLNNDLLSTDSLSSDSLNVDPLSEAPLLTAEPIPEHSIASTSSGWYRDDRTLTVRYRAIGHADPQLRALAELALEQRSSKLDAIGTAIENLPAVKACFDCHQPHRSSGEWNWHAEGMDLRERGFTKFSHQPHLHQPNLRDCSHCHEVNSNVKKEQLISASDQPHSKISEFLPMERNSCIDCHRSGSAATACTQCHRYHTELERRDASQLIQPK